MVLVLFVLAILSWPVIASAQTGFDDPRFQEQFEKCMEESDGPFPEPPTLVSDGQGGWRCAESNSFEPSLSWIIPFGLLWAAVPMVIAGLVASSRGESVGLALVLTLVLGWVGFLIVLFGMNRSARSAQAVLANAAAPRPKSDTIAERLQTIEDLRARGLITEDEYSNRRREILSET